MSEELLHTIPQSIGKYTYLALGETTIKQLMESGYIPGRAYKGILRKKPDGISAPNYPASEYNTILWGIDGNFNFSIQRKGRKYIITDHCGAIDILVEDILPGYLLYALQEEKRNNNFDIFPRRRTYCNRDHTTSHRRRRNRRKSCA